MPVVLQRLWPQGESELAELVRRIPFCQPAQAQFALQWTEQGLQLAPLGARPEGPVRVDFGTGAAAHRRLYGGGKGQLIAKAVGIQGSLRPSILDATAGLGRDSFVLASLGCPVLMLERNPVIAALLADGLRRAGQDPALVAIVERLQLRPVDALECMAEWPGEAPQVIYLDPMFPPREKSALVKKEMRLFRPLVGNDDDGSELLRLALSLASHRVAVKRARQARPLEGPPPGYQLLGKSSRYDIYPKRRLDADAGRIR